MVQVCGAWPVLVLHLAFYATWEPDGISSLDLVMVFWSDFCSITSHDLSACNGEMCKLATELRTRLLVMRDDHFYSKALPCAVRL